MKKKLITLLTLTLVLALSLSLLVACGDKTVEFDVKFDTNGGSAVATVKVEKGRKITQTIPTPTKDDGSMFLGWYSDEELTTLWKFESDIVTKNTTLYAKWRLLESKPSEVAMTNVAFSNSVQFVVKNAKTATYTVKLATMKPNGDSYIYGNDVEVSGGATVAADGYTVVWTPNGAPQGGLYRVTISTKNGDAAIEDVVLEGAYFKGEGAQANPYLITKDIDLFAITTGAKTIGADKFYKMASDVEIKTNYETATEEEPHTTKDTIFAGTLLGNDKKITILAGSNTGLFYKNIGLITDLVIDMKITTNTIASNGGLVNFNDGTISYVSTLNRDGSNESKGGVIGDISTLEQGIAGGIVGTNLANGKVTNCINNARVLASVGGGGIVGYNKGTIEHCTNYGRLGSGNDYTAAKGKDKATYSFAGGLVGVNEGTIKQSYNSALKDNAFAGNIFAQRSDKAGANNMNNVFGGVAGLNRASGIITECSNTAKRVHGDYVIGGLVGENVGTINNSYSTAQVGGRKNVGGLVGLVSGGTIENCYSTATFNANSQDKDSLNNPFDITDLEAGQYFAVSSSCNNCVYLADADGAAPTGTGNVTGDPRSTDMTSTLGAKFTASGELTWLSAYKVTITFQVGDKAPTTEQVTPGEAPTLPTEPTAEAGFVFTGWRKDLSDASTEWDGVSGFNKNTTLYACFEQVKPYVVKFDSNGGVGAMPDQAFAATENKALSLNTFTKDGFVFAGWLLNGVIYSDGQEVSMLSPKGVAVTLVAQWADLSKNYVSNGDFATGSTFTATESSSKGVELGYSLQDGNWVVRRSGNSKVPTLTPTIVGGALNVKATTNGLGIKSFYTYQMLTELEANTRYAISFDACVSSDSQIDTIAFKLCVNSGTPSKVSMADASTVVVTRLTTTMVRYTLVITTGEVAPNALVIPYTVEDLTGDKTLDITMDNVVLNKVGAVVIA